VLQHIAPFHATQKPELEPSALPLSRASSGADRAAGTGLRKRGRRRSFHANPQASC
jgi:hypothetical protein